MMTAPFDSTVLFYVMLFAVTMLFLMRFVPPVGARVSLGNSVNRYAHVPAETLEEAVTEEGKRSYFSPAGLIAIGCECRCRYSRRINNPKFRGGAAAVQKPFGALQCVLPARFAVPRERVHCRRGVEDEYNSLILAG